MLVFLLWFAVDWVACQRDGDDHGTIGSGEHLSKDADSHDIIVHLLCVRKSVFNCVIHAVALRERIR